MTVTTGHLRPAAELGVPSVLDVVTRVFGLEGTQRGDEFDLPCPDPAHDDHRPSCSINLSTGFFHCFSCGRGGDLIRLGAMVLGVHPDDIEDQLCSRTPDALLAMLTSITAELHTQHRPLAVAVLPQPADYAEGPLTELHCRGFDAATLRRWSVRYVPAQALVNNRGEPFSVYSSVGIPIMDRRHEVIAWCYRRTDASPRWQPRYTYTTGALLRDRWFGLQHHARARHIVVVEGALDAIWCDQHGVAAIALLGTSLSPAKVSWLGKYNTVTLLGDFDSAGAAAIAKIGMALGHRSQSPVYVARYATWMRATDPAELSGVDLELALARAIPWTQYATTQALSSSGQGTSAPPLRRQGRSRQETPQDGRYEPVGCGAGRVLTQGDNVRSQRRLHPAA